MRHGEALSNVLGILLGDPTEGRSAYGLTTEGEYQVREAALRLRSELGGAARDVIILSSDFLRTAQTAVIVGEVLATGRPVRLSRTLRERYFGRLEGKSHAEAKSLCANESMGPNDKPYGSESFTELCTRVIRAVVALESRYQHETVVLVSHSAPLQVLEAAFSDLEPENYQQVAALRFAEVRELALPDGS